MSDNEWLELVNESGDVVGRAQRYAVYKQGLRNFRSVEGFVRHPDGRLFIARRASHKQILPGSYEGYGEHIMPGESDIDAARRGLREEFGIDLPSLHFLFLGYTTPLEGMHGHAAVFIANTDQEPTLSGEHDWGAWLRPIDIVNILRKDPEQFRNNVRILFSKHARELFS